MREIFRSFAPDIISTHTAKSGFIGRLAARTLNIPVLYTPHGWSFTERMPRRERWVYLRAERFAAKYAARIIAVARYEREVALRYRIAEPSKLVAIHNGMVDVGPRLLANPGIQPPGIVMVARFEPPKDHALLVRALSDLKGLEWELNLVGNGPSMPAVRKLVESTGLAGRVHFLDERKDVPAILAAAQLFVLVTRSEGFPRSILEAMRAGLPVIASNAGGISEAVADGETGFVVPLSDGEVLKTRIVELITDPKLRVRMGGAARKRYERLFTFEHMYEKTFALYESLIGEQPARGARISFGA
jgi:glycosyltransferase involved in cell wall biosynthesis